MLKRNTIFCRSCLVLSFICFIFIGLVFGDPTYTYQIRTTIINVTTTATKLPATALVGRDYVQIQNVGNATVYIGNATVAANTTINGNGGTQVLPYSTWVAPYDHTVDIYGKVASGGCVVVVEEGK